MAKAISKAMARVLLIVLSLSASFAQDQQSLGLAGNLRLPSIASRTALPSRLDHAVASGNRLATLSFRAREPGVVEVRVYVRAQSVWRLEQEWIEPLPTDDVSPDLHLNGDRLVLIVSEPDSGPLAVTVRFYERRFGAWQASGAIGIAAPDGRLGSSYRASALSPSTFAVALRHGYNAEESKGSPKGVRYQNELVAFTRKGDGWTIGPRIDIDHDVPERNAMAAGDNRIAVAQPYATTFGHPDGAVRIFEVGTAWSAIQTLSPPAGTSVDGGCFGCALAWDGDKLVVGDHERERIWVFREQGGLWALPSMGHVLSTPGGIIGGYFGSSVAVLGDRILVGEPDRRLGTERVGGVVPFRLVEGAWQHGSVWEDGDGNQDGYGSEVLMGQGFGGAADPIELAGEPDFTFSNQFDLRAPSIAGGWTPDLALSSPDGALRDAFGGHLAADGPDRLLVSAPGSENALNLPHGRVYYYERVGGRWERRTELPLPPEFDQQATFGGHRMGHAVALRGNLAMVAAPGYDHPQHGDDIGAVFVYERAQGLWQLRERLLAPIPQAGAQFGSAVVFDRLASDRVVISAPLEDLANPTRPDTGRAYLYRFADNQWRAQRTVDPPASVFTNGERMGATPTSMVLIGHRLYIASNEHATSGFPSAGLVRVYRELPDRFDLEYELSQPFVEPFSLFGTAIATDSIDPDSATLYVGAPRATGTAAGAGRTGALTRAECSLGTSQRMTCTRQTLPDPPGLRDGDWYGYFVDAQYGSVLASAPLAPLVSGGQTYPQHGALYLLQPDDAFAQRLVSPLPGRAGPTQFGDQALVLSGDAQSGITEIAVGAPRNPDRLEAATQSEFWVSAGRVWFFDAAQMFSDGFETAGAAQFAD